MLSKKIAVAALLCALVVGSTACTAKPAETTHKAVVQMNASWADAYASLSDMTTHSDAIVQGTVEEQLKTTVANGIPYTDFTFQVAKWIKGDGATTITIHQTGGETADEVATVDDDPLLVPGADHVLFLHEYEPGMYYIVGGPTGRINVDNGKLTAFPGSVVAEKIPSTLTLFSSQVAAADAADR